MSQSSNILSYIERDSPVHRLSGVTKMIVFLLWTIVCMVSYDTRVLLVVLILAITVFYIAKIKFSEVRTVLLFIGFFLLLNDVAIYIFSPEQGVAVYGTRTLLYQFNNRFTVTTEQLFYLFNVTLKYFTVVPVALIFLVTTDPSEFAGALTKIKVPYRISYAVSLTLRYISDIQNDFRQIAQSQEARGVDLSKESPLPKRVAGLAGIAVPLIFSSLDRIELISNAMDLRGFGKHEKRTWYYEKPITKTDLTVIIVAFLLSALALWITFHNGSRYFNPFI